jgi:hypothetical protein
MKKFTLLDLKKTGLMVKIEKISDQEYFSLTKNKFSPLFEDYFFLVRLNRAIYQKYKFNLPKIYAALYTLYGLHNSYDDYKCSFSYRFRLTIIKGPNSIYTYLLHIMDMKGNPPYFTFYRPLGEHELNRKGTYVEHVDSEFSKEAMQEFMAQFAWNLLDTFEELEDKFKKNFFRTVPYDYTIYGFKDGAFFEHCYYHDSNDDDEEEDEEENEDNNEGDDKTDTSDGNENKNIEADDRGKTDTSDDNENENNEEDEEDEDDHGYSAYLDAVEKYKNDPKMKGQMSKRYD